MDDRRKDAGRREDRRVRRTRALLEQGLIRLLEKKPIRAITVKELTDLVNINRGTFYLYYHDIYDMVEKLEDDYYRRFSEVLSSHNDEPPEQCLHNTLADIFVFMEENRDLLRVLLGENGDLAFLQKINLELKEKCRSVCPGMAKISMEEFEYRYSFASLGVLGIVRFWISENCRHPAARVAALAERCIVRGVLPQHRKES